MVIWPWLVTLGLVVDDALIFVVILSLPVLVVLMPTGTTLGGHQHQGHDPHQGGHCPECQGNDGVFPERMKLVVVILFIPSVYGIRTVVYYIFRFTCGVCTVEGVGEIGAPFLEGHSQDDLPSRREHQTHDGQEQLDLDPFHATVELCNPVYHDE